MDLSTIDGADDEPELAHHGHGWTRPEQGLPCVSTMRLALARYNRTEKKKSTIIQGPNCYSVATAMVQTPNYTASIQL